MNIEPEDQLGGKSSLDPFLNTFEDGERFDSAEWQDWRDASDNQMEDET